MNQTSGPLYHGSALGWLEHSGFELSTKAYGENFKPSAYIFIAANKQTAEFAALNAKNKCLKRKADGILTDTDFIYKNVGYIVQRYLYEVRLLSTAEIIDLTSKKLPKKQKKRVYHALRSYHKKNKNTANQTSNKLRYRYWYFDYILQLLRVYLKNQTWKQWFDYVLKNYDDLYLHNGELRHYERDGQLARFCEKADFHGVKNIERENSTTQPLDEADTVYGLVFFNEFANKQKWIYEIKLIKTIP